MMYNTVEAIVDNPILLGVLQKYKDMGLFGNNAPIFGIGTYESTNKLWNSGFSRSNIVAPAFYYFEDADDDVQGLFLSIYAPESLEKVLSYIISLIHDGRKYLNENVLGQLEEELRQKKDEIMGAYNLVYWRNKILGDDSNQEFKFEYDPVNGPSYTMEDLWEEDEEEQEQEEEQE
jgi:hypothetical protein